MRLLILAVGIGVAACAPPAIPSAPSAALGRAVRLALPTDRGDLLTLPRPDGAPVVVDFFSPSCASCEAPARQLFRARGALAAAGARVIFVGLLAGDESTESAAAALLAWSVDPPFAVDRDGVSARDLHVRSLPATVVLDGRGVVRWVAPAGATVQDIEGVVRAIARTRAGA